MFFKNDVFFCNSTLLENSALDNKNNNIWVKNQKTELKSNIILFYVYAYITMKIKIILLVYVDYLT